MYSFLKQSIHAKTAAWSKVQHFKLNVLLSSGTGGGRVVFTGSNTRLQADLILNRTYI